MLKVLVVAGALVVVMLLVLGACAPALTEEKEAATPEKVTTDEGQEKEIEEEELTPLPDSLEKVRFIAKVKNSLPFDQRGNLNTYGVYVQSGRNREPTLPKEGILYMVGGRTIPKLIFLDEDSGETTVVKYEQGDWLKSLDLSYEKAKKVWVAMQTNDRAAIMQALSIEEPDRPRYIDLDKQARGGD